MVDQGFLGLVLFGVKPHDDPAIRNSLAVGDRLLRADTPHGPIWRRFTFDGYGETPAGATGRSSRPPPTRPSGGPGRC